MSGVTTPGGAMAPRGSASSEPLMATACDRARTLAWGSAAVGGTSALVSVVSAMIVAGTSSGRSSAPKTIRRMARLNKLRSIAAGCVIGGKRRACCPGAAGRVSQ